MTEKEHGNMNSDSQQKTFESFVTIVTRVVIVLLAVLVFMAIFAR